MSTMEVGTLSSVDRTVLIGSLIEALVAEAFLAAGKTLACLLIAINANKSPNLSTIDGRFPLDELSRRDRTCEENKDASDTEDDDEDEEEQDDDDDDDGDDEDFSGEGEDDEDPDDDPEANGAGDSDNDDDNDEDEDDEDGEEDDEEEEDEEEEEEGSQPPSKKRK